ncbi:MAG: hypothetical protein FWE04_05675 [Oscillospiraceae bacterium]|nr:hypothetical protein [Oscillospiraceae bacterium]
MKKRTKKYINIILVICMIVILIPLGTSSLITLSSGAVFMVSAGNNHTLMIRNDGTLWAWGGNANGRLGNGNTNNSAVMITPNGPAGPWIWVSAGGHHSLAVLNDGTLWSWGYNGQNQLGRSGDNTVPMQVGSDTNWIAVAAGSVHSLALKSDGSLWSWGYNGQGQLGRSGDNTVPMQVGTDYNWESVAGGGFWSGYAPGYDGGHTLAIKQDGSLWAWGFNASGQLGQQNSTSNLSVPTQVGTYNDWVSVSAGCYHSAGIRGTRNGATISDHSGSLWTWGGNGQYQLGNGNTSNSTVPVQIGAGSNWIDVSGAQTHTMAVTADGHLYGWGTDTEGWCGLGATNSNVTYTTPQQVNNDTNWIKVSAGWYHSAAVKADGSLWMMGSNGVLQIGNGDTNTGDYVNVPSVILRTIAIYAQPEDAMIAAGQSAAETISVDARETLGASVVYQWYQATDVNRTNPIAISGAIGATFTIPTNLTEGTYFYYVVISDPSGVAASITSNVATVMVWQAVIEITQTLEAPANENESFVFQIESDGGNIFYATILIGAGNTTASQGVSINDLGTYTVTAMENNWRYQLIASSEAVVTVNISNSDTTSPVEVTFISENTNSTALSGKDRIVNTMITGLSSPTP